MYSHANIYYLGITFQCCLAEPIIYFKCIIITKIYLLLIFLMEMGVTQFERREETMGLSVDILNFVTIYF